MKGLILTHMGRREEGIELVKKGMRFDLTSHICWHVFGLIQKGQKNYEEALKSYTQALRFDKVRSTCFTKRIYVLWHGRACDSLRLRNSPSSCRAAMPDYWYLSPALFRTLLT